MLMATCDMADWAEARACCGWRDARRCVDPEGRPLDAPHTTCSTAQIVADFLRYGSVAFTEIEDAVTLADLVKNPPGS